MDNDPKHTVKATKEFFKAKKWNVLQWPSQSPDPNLAVFHLLKTTLKGNYPKNKQELKTAVVEAWQSITRDQTLVMMMRRFEATKGYHIQVHPKSILLLHELQNTKNEIKRA